MPLNREVLRRKLKRLAESPDPTITNPMGACCYFGIFKYWTKEYVCPIDNEKTIYDDMDRTAALVLLGECRSEMKYIKRKSIRLDEREFCRRCCPLVETPRLFLVIEYTDRIHRYIIKDSDVIRKLRFFLKEEAVFVNDHQAEKSMKEFVSELEDALGLNT